MNSSPSQSYMVSTSRLLKKKDAAAYCSLSAPTFGKVCPVQPLILTAGRSSVQRYDKLDIDRWINSLNGLNDNSHRSKEEILNSLDS